MKKWMLLFCIISTIVLSVFWGCKHDPVVTPDNGGNGNCDTLQVTYNEIVYPLLQQYCLSCHSGTTPSAGMDFNDYATVAAIAQNGALLGAIRHETGYSAMPQNGLQLSDCDIAKFEIWIRDTTFIEPPVGIPCDPDTVYFENYVLPLLQSSCGIIGCHDPETATEGIILTDYNNIISTGEIVAFDPEDSELYEKITEDDPDKIMPPPPRSPLTQEQKDAIYKWIMQGALNNHCENEDCDTLNVTFSGTIWPVVQNRCFGCHSGADPSGGVSLENYNSLVNAVNSGRLMGAIKHENGFSAMPKNGAKLSDCNISQFQKWINDGTPNN